MVSLMCLSVDFDIFHTGFNNGVINFIVMRKTTILFVMKQDKDKKRMNVAKLDGQKEHLFRR